MVPSDTIDMPRRIAVLSDVHGNIVALRAVLDDAASLGINHLVVAGDMVNFGPNPDEVVDLLIERQARMIRGNHEKDYVALYRTDQMPAWWSTDLPSMCWSMERLGPGRRSFLTALPDRLLLDDTTLVVHGSPRHVRDEVLVTTSNQDLEAMFSGKSARLAFVGHTHRPVIRHTDFRTVVNVGSVGFPMDGDPRAAYVIAQRQGSGDAEKEVSVRRVGFDNEAAITAYDNGLRDVDPIFAEIMVRTLRTGRDYLGPWLRVSAQIDDDDVESAFAHFLAANPQR